VCSKGGKDIFHSIELDLRFGNKIEREEFKMSHNINIKTNTATTEITLPKEERAFQANS
jgi:hypothetical protein